MKLESHTTQVIIDRSTRSIVVQTFCARLELIPSSAPTIVKTYGVKIVFEHGTVTVTAGNGLDITHRMEGTTLHLSISWHDPVKAMMMRFRGSEVHVCRDRLKISTSVLPGRLYDWDIVRDPTGEQFFSRM